MGIDGHNHLTILGPSKTLDIIENGGIVLSDEEITGDKDLIYFKNNYFTESWASCRMVRQKPTKKDDGKVTRLRKECQEPSCGPATFMAIHKNRYYCGKCHNTLVFQEGDKK